MNYTTETVKKNDWVQPVGTFTVKDGQTGICLLPMYRAGLHGLGQFSHVIIFTSCAGDQALFAPHLTVGEILRVDEKDGWVEVRGVQLAPGIPVFDIKPYFPVEDRVQTVFTPQGEAPNFWQPGEINNLLAPARMDEMPEGTSRWPVQMLGKIHKQGTQTWIEMNPEFRSSLAALAGYSHVKLVWWFHQLDELRFRRVYQVTPPYGKDEKVGVFASRSPVRPNPLGLSTARILSVDAEQGRLEVSELDAYDGTPLVACLPYLPALDRVSRVHVPDGVRHWPEWLLETSETQAPAMFVAPGDLARLEERVELESDKPLAPLPTWEWPQTDELAPVGDWIEVVGARQHNLKNISLRLPRNRMTVVTGVSGSGKSSLVFDTIYAEAQRRYMGGLSSLAREALDQLQKPDVDAVLGLMPAVAIEQKTLGRNPRSTVGTLTEVYDDLQLLFTRIGHRHCPVCGREMKASTPAQVATLLCRLPAGSLGEIQAMLSADHWADPLPLALAPHEARRREVQKIIETAYRQGNGVIRFLWSGQEYRFSEHETCAYCQRVFFKLSPALFRYNSPDGMCADCHGLGVQWEVDPALIVPYPERSVLDMASPWWGNLRQFREKPSGNWWRGELIALADAWQVDLEMPWNELPEKFRQAVLYGCELDVSLKYEGSNHRTGEITRPVTGAVHHIHRLFMQNGGEESHQFLQQFMRQTPCSTCEGERLGPEGRLVTVGTSGCALNKRYPQVAAMTVAALADWVEHLPQALDATEQAVARELLIDLRARLAALMEIGLHYLTFDRSAATLSGGEGQRIRLASRLQCGLRGLLYVLDEPSMGLHPRDHRALLETLARLRDQGNTVLLVEHDADAMRAADWLVDLGPGAGVNGGTLIAAGTPAQVMADAQSLTGQYLSGSRQVAPARPQRKQPAGWIDLHGATLHNLSDVDVSFPLGVLCCISGVSGSGKSSLVSKTLSPALARLLQQGEEVPGPYRQLLGAEQIAQVIPISQAPIGRSSRSTPATYVEVFDEIRKVFAATPEARRRKMKVNHFSYNSKEGACPACGGVGEKKIEMYFLPDIWVTCQECGGARYQDDVLEVKINERSIADVLQMDILQALDFFQDHPAILRILSTLKDVGLDYLKLGQSSLTLSGGEAQRVKLARELSRVQSGHTLYILDEPTTGLHFDDIQKLLEVLHRLTEAGNSVLVIEHNLDVIRSADWVIDMGPEGGSQGGQVVATGRPEEIAVHPTSHTGRCLREMGGMA